MRRVMSLNSDGSTVIHRAIATTTPPEIAGHLNDAPEFIADAAQRDIARVADFRTRVRPAAGAASLPRCGPGTPSPSPITVLCRPPFSVPSVISVPFPSVPPSRSLVILRSRNILTMRYRTFGRTGWQGLGESATACGAWAGGPGPTTRIAALRLDRRVRAARLQLLRTRVGPTARARAKRCSARRCARARTPRAYIATKIPPMNMKWPGKAEYAVQDTYPPAHIREYTEKSLAESRCADDRPAGSSMSGATRGPTMTGGSGRWTI
jgi:hypothetical protein